MPKLQKKSTMNRTKGFIQGQFDTLARKKAIEAPIASNLSEDVVAKTLKAKNTLESLQTRKESGPMRDQLKKKHDVMSKLSTIKPSTWNNIPVPVTEAAT